MSLEGMTEEEKRIALTDVGCKYIVALVRLLKDAVGKEKAKELIRTFRYDPHVKKGREAAEEMGHPKDVETFVQRYFVEEMAKIPSVEPVKFTERSSNRAVCYADWYCPGRSIAKMVAGDKDMIEIFKDAYCVHDIAYAKGFNPDLKMTITKTFFDGDDRCEFVTEV